MIVVVAIIAERSYEHSLRVMETMIDLPYRIAESISHRLIATAKNRHLLAFKIKRLQSIEKPGHIFLKIACPQVLAPRIITS